MHEGYKLWDWRYDLENERVLYLLGDKMDIYKPSNLAGTRRLANRWVRSRMGQPAVECGKVCTVREAGVAVKGSSLIRGRTRVRNITRLFDGSLEGMGMLLDAEDTQADR